MKLEERLKLGLRVMAGAGRPDRSDWFEGHVGAAIIAAAFFITENDLPSEISAAVATGADRLAKKNEGLFDGVPEPTAVSETGGQGAEAVSLDETLRLLDENLVRLRNSGHGVIFGTLALKAIQRLGAEFTNQEIVTGINRLLVLAQEDDRDRFYRVPDHDQLNVTPEDNIPSYDDPATIARASLAEVDAIYETHDIDGHTYFFNGEVGHILTHAHALIELSEIGYDSLARKGYAAHQKQIKAARGRPTDVPASAKYLRTEPSKYTPRESEYWTRDLDETHIFKYPYSARRLLNLVPAGEVAEFERKLAYLWD